MAELALDASEVLLPWHAPLWERLQGALRARRLPHALLLCGPPGLGKGRFAGLLADAVLCEAPGSEGLPCGACRGCRMQHAGTHPDRQRCELQEDQSAITVEQVRAITGFLSLKPHYGHYQVAVIRPAERMNLNAANSLLKTLEEPPAGALLILVTARLGALPATVRSRCQRINFSAPEPAVARRWLAGRLPAGADTELLLGLTGGAPLAALALAEQGRLERREAMLEALEGISRGGTDPVAVAGDWLKFGPKESLYWLYGWLMDMARLQASEHPPFLGNPDSRAALARMAGRVPAPRLLEQLERIVEALRLTDGQANAQLLLEDTLLAWAAASRAAPRSR